MKNVIIALALAIVPSSAFAECNWNETRGAWVGNCQAHPPVQSSTISNTTDVTSVAVAAQAQHQSQEVYNAGNNTGNSASTSNVNVVHERSASTSTAPALTSGDDTCMGSSSVGGQGVGFGFSVGSTWTDENCIRLKNARLLYNMGRAATAQMLMCQDEAVRAAAKATGDPMCDLVVKKASR